MPDIFHQFPIKADMRRVFDAVSTPEGLDTWWTKRSSGIAQDGASFELWFGPDYDWRASVSRCQPQSLFELTMTEADPDWIGTRVGFLLQEKQDSTIVQFHHLGWAECGDHYRVSMYCWAMYLRLLKRHLEHGQTVPYESRLDV